MPGAPAQVLPPWSFVHALPQPAQFWLVPSVVSQPEAALQSAKPELQPPMVHVPVLHEAPALRYVHGTPQLPQSVTVRTLRSHPLSRMPSQFPKPALHVGEQPVVGLQAVVPLAFWHTSLHERQCAVVPSWVSQAGAPATHSAKPVAHEVEVHVPPPHVSLEFGMSQEESQLPQSVSVQIDVSQPFEGFASQLSKPALHVYWQPFVPLQLTWPCVLEQPLPQAAQFVSVPRGVSQPVEGFASQLPQFAAQAPSAQLPLVHDSAAFARSQSTSQSPQSVSVRMLRSQPLPRSPSQLFQPVSHIGVQPVAVQDVPP